MEPIHILLVEDNEGDIFLTTEALHESKIANKLSIVRDGWEAIQFLEKKGEYVRVTMPDLILLDVNLPKMNGHEVLTAIKSNENTKHIPVIMLTTSSSEKDIYQSYKNYVNCYITKPIDAGDFLKVVASIEHFWISIVTLPKTLHK
ncbi:response regulator [Emticicia agri]|uniref:Response regulator n=1 Tax=Emticicia agri TaxID=2492393 RepID=A0A4Q5LZL1_9BACT|nr:response regulator [Emticicia agri]RYU95361.1 response regulator [Emticicia agri]